MAKADDSSLTKQQYERVRREAARLLKQTDAIGVFPTPVSDIMAAGRIKLAPENVLDERFLRLMRYKAGPALRRAIAKVVGILDLRDRLVYIDRSLLVVKQTFVKLHETGHAVLPWQRELYTIIEDSKHELSPDTAELFDREANVFATEMLFQLDGFVLEASDYPFGIKTPISLSRKYGASVYASVRQYVAKNLRDCIVLILNQPEPAGELGYRVSIRRSIASPSFQEKFGCLDWPEYFTPEDEVGTVVPVDGRRMSRQREITLIDRNGDRHECLAEAFTSTYQVFVLIQTL